MYINIYLLFILMIFLAICIITVKNPIIAVVSLIIIYLITSVVFILLGAEFIGILLVIVYVGAISVLFLFVIMMLNSRLVELYNSFKISLFVLRFVFFIILIELFFIYAFNLNIISCYIIENKYYDLWIYSLEGVLNIKDLGEMLINNYNIYLLISAVILLLALIGSIVLTFKTTSLLLDSYVNTKHIFLNKKINKAYGILRY